MKQLASLNLILVVSFMLGSGAVSAQPLPLGANADWTSGAEYWGTAATFFADVTNDGLADGVVVNATSVTTRRSSGAAPLGGNETTVLTFPSNATDLRTYQLADVTGDGRADLIAVKTGSIVVSVAGSGNPMVWGTETTWLSGGYFGNVGIFFVRINNDNCSDAVVINTGAGAGIYVRYSNCSSGFSTTQTTLLGTGFTGDMVFMADVTSPIGSGGTPSGPGGAPDGLADAIAFRYQGLGFYQVYVRPNRGSTQSYGSGAEGTMWATSTVVSMGPKFFVDWSADGGQGDGDRDLVDVSLTAGGTVNVFPNNGGASFSATGTDVTGGLFYGNRATTYPTQDWGNSATWIVDDIDGSGVPDGVVTNSGAGGVVTVRLR